jgi:vacuolar-type H+-ATPase subunit C/Vma6
MAAEIILVAAGSVVVASALGVTIVMTAQQAAFLYANARIAARSTYILTNEKLRSLANSGSLPELINQLKDTDYSLYLETIDKNALAEFNSGIEKGFINSLLEIRNVSPKKFRHLFDIYVKIAESKLLKIFFRSRFSNVKIDSKLLEPIGIINPSLIKHLAETKTIADMKIALRETEYAEILEKSYNSIEEFDIALEKRLQESIYRIIDDIKVYDKKSVIEIFNKREEIRGILMLLKLIIRNADKKLISGLIKLNNLDNEKNKRIGGTAYLDFKKILEKLSDNDLNSFVTAFESTEYGQALKKAYSDFEKYGNYYGFEKELLRHYYQFIKEHELSHPLGPYPIVSYITKKENEQKNLLIIAKGISSGTPKEEIMEMLI